MKHTQSVIPAKAKPRTGIQSVNDWMPDQARHDKLANISCNFLSLICVNPRVEQSEIPIHRERLPFLNKRTQFQDQKNHCNLFYPKD